MAKATRYTFSGSSGAVTLPDEWFGSQVNRNAMYQAVRAQQTNDRAGTAHSKTRKEVRGGGAKPWRQKGTGRARVGSIRSPLWKGGGVIHGPRAKRWHLDVPRQVRRTAFRSALTQKAIDGAIRVVELDSFDEPRTQRLAKALKGWDVEGAKVLFLTATYEENLYKSGRNIPGLTVKRFRDASTLDVLRHDVLVVEEGAWTTRGGEAPAPTPEPVEPEEPAVTEESNDG